MTTALWTWDDLLAASGGEADGRASVPIGGVSIDTRTLDAGDLFVALKDVRDGHDFVGAAFARGAAAALVSRTYQRQDADGALIRCDDVLGALEAIGVAARARLAPSARVVAVTGSAGKTGTKEMLRACFARLGAVHASEKSYNNHWGVPLTLARMPQATDFAVFEIGMNHADEIRPLTRMVRPHAAIVTTVEAVHLEHFASVEGIADAKAEIFEGLVPGGAAIIKFDNPHAGRLITAAKRAGARPVTFGFDESADVSGADVVGRDVRFGPNETSLDVDLGSRRVALRLSMPGRHIAENALAVAAALDAVGTDVERGLGALANLEPPSGRGARTVLDTGAGTILLIDESYNANPASMRAALATLATVPRADYGRRIAVLGDMLELGPDAAALHGALKDAVEQAGVDILYACGPLMRTLYEGTDARRRGNWAAKAADLKPILAADLKAGDVVVVKASNGTKLGGLVEGLKAEFGKGRGVG